MADTQKGGEAWQDSKRLAMAMLHDRALRRRWIGRMLLADLLFMAAGLWWVDGWLLGNPWRFLIWWAACAAFTCLIMLCAIYDALAVIREERAKFR
jgi:hypothetical protein